MYGRKHHRQSGFGKAAIIFSVSLVGILAIGLALSGVLFGGREDTPLQSRTAPAPGRPETPAVGPVDPVMESMESATKTPVTTVVVETPTLPETREVSYAEAETAYLEGDYVEALDLFTLYTEQHPGNAWGHYMFGLSAWKAGFPDIGEDGFRSALRIDPRHVKSTLNLARVLLDDGRPGEALTICTEATRLDTTRGEVYRLIGRSHHNLGRVDEAVTAYRRAITLDVEDAWAMNNLGLLLIESGRYDEAVGPLAAAVEIEPDRVIFRNNLGIALERTGRFEAAAEAYRAALQVDDTNEKVLANLTRVDPLSDSPETVGEDLGEVASRFLSSLREEKTDKETLVTEAQPEPQPTPEVEEQN